MKILLASSEAIPFAKTGGSGRCFRRSPEGVGPLGPGSHFDPAQIPPGGRKALPAEENLLRADGSRGSADGNGRSLRRGTGTEFRALLIRKDSYYDREHLYGTPSGDYEDNAERFTFFSRAVMESGSRTVSPDIIHCHDWQTALIPVYLKTLYRRDPRLARVRFGLHHPQHRLPGSFLALRPAHDQLGLGTFHPAGLEFYGKLNFLKGGIVFADAVTTVSRKYMEEIQTPEFGVRSRGRPAGPPARPLRHPQRRGLRRLVARPRTLLSRRNTIRAELSGKKACKADLQKEFGLPVEDGTPIIGIISRLAEQKGFDLITAVMDDLMKLNVQMIILGTGDEKYHLLLEALGKKYPAPDRRSRSPSTTPWPTRSRPAPTCSSCPPATNPAG